MPPGYSDYLNHRDLEGCRICQKQNRPFWSIFFVFCFFFFFWAKGTGKMTGSRRALWPSLFFLKTGDETPLWSCLPNTLEKTLMLGRIEGRRRRRRGQQKKRSLDGIIDSMDMNLSKLWRIVNDTKAWHAAVHGVTKCWTQLSDWTKTKKYWSKNVRKIHFGHLSLYCMGGYSSLGVFRYKRQKELKAFRNPIQD